MNYKEYESKGLPLLSYFLTKRNSRNNKKRNIKDIGAVTAAYMLSATETTPDNPIMICGRIEKAFSTIQQLVKMSSQPFILIGTKKDVPTDSCLRLLNVEWENNHPQKILPEGNGLLILNSDAQTLLLLKDCLSSWETHYIVLCLGNGLRLDGELLDLLNGIGHYVLITDALQRSVRNTENIALSIQHLLSSMDCIIATATGSFAEELIGVIPKYEYEKVNNNLDFSLHRHTHPNRNGISMPNIGGSFRLGQSRTIETKNLLTQDDLRELQRTNKTLILNNKTALTWVAQLVG